jgi:hypothetical protein
MVGKTVIPKSHGRKRQNGRLSFSPNFVVGGDGQFDFCHVTNRHDDIWMSCQPIENFQSAVQETYSITLSFYESSVLFCRPCRRVAKYLIFGFSFSIIIICPLIVLYVDFPFLS